MTDTPPEKLLSIEGVEKREDETLKEFVERVGKEANTGEVLLDDALEYIMEWHYSEQLPADEQRFQRFIDRVRDGSSGSDASTGGVPESASTEAMTGSETVTLAAVEAFSETTSADISAGFRSGLQGKEPRKLVTRFLGILVTAPLLGWMMGRAWVPGHTLYDQGQSLLAQVLGLQPVPAIELIGVFALGFYVALLLLFTFDIKKRVQGMLLITGSVLAVGVLWRMSVFLPVVDFTTDLNLVGGVLGVAVGLFTESGQLLAVDLRESSFQRPALNDGSVPEFRFAAVSIFGLLSIVVVGSVIQAVLAGVIRSFDVFAVVVFLVLLYQFIQYESETNYMTLGPERSGKSMMMLGLCLELLRNSGTNPRPNAYVQDGLERTSNLSEGDARWPVPSTARDDVRTGSFEVISGSYFPRRLELRAMDYAGQHLGRIAELFGDGGIDDAQDTVPQTVANNVLGADTLVFLLDVERLVFPGEFQAAGVTDEENISWGLEQYGAILENTDASDIIVVATKCDILLDQGKVAGLSSYDSFDGFRDAVTGYLRSRPDVEQLLSMAGESTIHPVQFATEKRDEQYIPALDDGTLVPVGYDHLINEIRARQ